jgi:hypothetical protein
LLISKDAIHTAPRPERPLLPAQAGGGDSRRRPGFGDENVLRPFYEETASVKPGCHFFSSVHLLVVTTTSRHHPLARRKRRVSLPSDHASLTRWTTAIVQLPREAESGSAGVQPDEEYLGRRCADAASGPGGALARTAFYGHRTPEPCLKKPNLDFSPRRRQDGPGLPPSKSSRASTRETAMRLVIVNPSWRLVQAGNGSTPPPTFYSCRANRRVARSTSCLIRPKALAPAWCGTAHSEGRFSKESGPKTARPDQDLASR